MSRSWASRRLSRRRLLATFAAALSLAAVGIVPASLQAPRAAADTPLGFVSKLGIDNDVRSGARILEDELALDGVILPDSSTPTGTGGSSLPQIQLRGGNVRVNDPLGDYVQQFPGFRPFVHATQSEVSSAAFGKNMVIGYNDSAGLHVSPNPTGPGVVVDRVTLSGYSVSHDGGQTWTPGFVPPAPGAADTFGDPSVGVDRHGNFFYATLGADSLGRGTVQVNRSTDGGYSWSSAAIVQQDNGSDKEWLAVGPDPTKMSRDNVYVTWTSFQPGACELRLGRSTDGGATWTAQTILVPTTDADPTHPTNCLQFSNPVVDAATGRLYVPFLRYSNADQDFIQMLVSDDAGQTFHFNAFNVPSAPDPTVLPITQPGELTECGGSNFRLTIHTAANAGPGRSGVPRYINASRMVMQPAIAAYNNAVYLAWSASTDLAYGSGTGSNVLSIRSLDGGQTWSSPTQVNPATDSQHVLPSLAIDNYPNGVHISYYTQHPDGTVDLDLANSHDGGQTFPSARTVRLTSTAFSLPPTNIPLTGAPNFSATNYDRQIAVCYGLGEYQSVTAANGSLYAGWGDARDTLTEPVNPLDPISGQTHPEQDVFFQKVKAQ